MDRRRFLLTSLLGVLTAPPSVVAQPRTRTWRIGYLSLVSGKLEHYRPWTAAFRAGLRERGYVEGENVVIEQRYAAGQMERLPDLAAELVRLKGEVLVAAPAGSAPDAKRATSTIPIVFMGEFDPVGTGLVASLARPGRNVTGLADAHADLLPKRLELLNQMVPSASRIGVLWNPSNASTATQLKALQAAAPALGLTIVSVEVRGPGRSDLDRALATLEKEHASGLLVIPSRRSATSVGHPPRMGGGRGADVIRYRLRRALPAGRDPGRRDPEGREAGRPARRAADEVRVVVNLKTAKALSLAIPASLRARADHVIE